MAENIFGIVAGAVGVAAYLGKADSVQRAPGLSASQTGLLPVTAGMFFIVLGVIGLT